MPQAIGRVVSIGDELVLGRTVDTNATHISRWLNDRGLRVDRLTVVGDGLNEIVRALRDAARGAAVVIATGGLGPTDDDRTRHALAMAMGQPLVQSQEAWKAIVAHYARIRPGAQVPRSNRRQALLPHGAQLLDNDRGTAPGMLGQVDGCWIASMPGVPHEMKAMLDRFGARLPRLLPRLKIPSLAEAYFAGIGESNAQELLGNLISACDPQVGITASELGHITLRVVGNRSEAVRCMAAIRRRLAKWELPENGLAASLVARLARDGKTITAAESATGGHIASQLTAVPGASRVLREATLAYHQEVKTERLGVPSTLIAREGVVSSAVALAMASGALERAGADLAIATTGVAGPTGGTKTTPVGTLWVAVATPNVTTAREYRLSGTRERIQSRGAAQALLLAWEVLSGRAEPRK